MTRRPPPGTDTCPRSPPSPPGRTAGDPHRQPRPPPRAPQARPSQQSGHPPRPPGQAAHRRPARSARTGPVADALRDRRPCRGTPVPRRRGSRPGVPPRPGHVQGRRDRVRPLGHRHRPPSAPAATRSPIRAGIPCRAARARVRFASPCRGGCLSGDRTRPAVLPARRVPVQAGHRRPRPAQEGPTLHQLRHSPSSTWPPTDRRPELQAKSRHLHLGSLGRYVQLGEQTSAQVTADADPQDDAGLAGQARTTPHHGSSAVVSLDFPRLLPRSHQESGSSDRPVALPCRNAFPATM
jgi:hypothetical protein